MSVATFVDHYLRIFDFPADVLDALTSGKVNLFEAEQLARIVPQRLDVKPAEATRKRAEILETHLQSRSSGERLRRRINELLAPLLPESSSEAAADLSDMQEGLENFDPYDPSHLFWEEIKNLGFAFRDIRREDLTDELLEELLQASQPLWSVIAKIQRRKQQQHRGKLIL
jgi:hypothetical protein